MNQNKSSEQEKAAEAEASAVNELVGFELMLKFGEYELRLNDDDSFWLANGEGEGMMLWYNDIAEMLQEFWDKHF